MKFYQYSVSPYLTDKIRNFFLEVTFITHLPLKKDLIFIVWLTSSEEIIDLATYHFRNKEENGKLSINEEKLLPVFASPIFKYLNNTPAPSGLILNSDIGVLFFHIEAQWYLKISLNN